MHRRTLLVSAGALVLCISSPVLAANAAEDFVALNIQKGFDILNDASLGAPARRERFASFLLGLTDVRRVALALLGDYAARASAADLDAYVAAYQDYAMSVYQSYFALYAGQTLKVVSSRERAPGDYIVNTVMTGGNALPVDFRVRTDGASPLLVDVGVAGVWLSLAQRAEFTSALSASHGDVKNLTAQLRRMTRA